MPGPLQLRVTYPVQFRLGMRMMVNVNGTNEERAFVARHTATAIVLRQGLQHRHGVKERILHVPLQHKKRQAWHRKSCMSFPSPSQSTRKQWSTRWRFPAKLGVFLRHPPTTDDLLVRVLPETDANDAVAFRKAGTVELQDAGWVYSCISLFYYLAPDWTTKSVNVRRTQRFSIFVTALSATFFVQHLYFFHWRRLSS